MTKTMYVGVPSYNVDNSTLLLITAENLRDISPYSRSVTNDGVTNATSVAKFGSNSMYFNGSSMLRVSSFNFFVGDWTIDWWECPTASNSKARFSSSYLSADGVCGGLLLGYSGTLVYASTVASGSGWDIVSGATMLSNTLNTWTHWAFVKTGMTLRSYRNGVLYATASVSSDIGFSSSYPFAIGDYRAGDRAPFVGYMDMFRISRGARWEGNFTPPTKSNAEYRRASKVYVGVPLPSGYTPVEYIKSTGTQWIDSGVTIGPSTWVEADLMFDSAFDWNMMFGAWGELSLSLKSSKAVCVSVGGTTSQDVGSSTTTGVKYHIELRPGVGYIQDNAAYFVGGTSNSCVGRNLLLFAASDASTGNNPYQWTSYGVGKIYGLKIYSNNTTLVRDFVPCLNPSGTPGLYDFKNKAFYSNKGSGSFSYGAQMRSVARKVKKGYVGAALPSGYTPLDYIESTGTEYIDTGFKHNQNTRVVMDVQATSITANAWAFEGRIAYYSAAQGVFFYYDGYGTWCADYATSDNRKQFSGIATTDRLSIDFNKNSVTINGSTQTFTATSFQSTCNLTLLAANTNGTVAGHLSARLYSCKIYDNGTLIRDFVPCKNESGTCGLFDVKNNRFYGNAGTKGSFRSGPVNWSKAQGVARLFFDGDGGGNILG